MNIVTDFFRDTIPSMLENEFLQGGMVLSIMGIIFYQLKSIPSRVFHYVKVLSTRSLAIRESEPFFNDVLSYITENICFMSVPRHSQLRMVESKIHRDADISRFVVKLWGRYCLVSLSPDDQRGIDGDGGGIGVGGFGKKWVIHITTFGTDKTLANITDMIRKKWENETTDKVEVCIESKYGGYDSYYKRKRDPKSLCFDDDLFGQVYSKCLKFIASEKIYNRRGIPWRMGIMLKGEPGTGKTSLIHALASKMGRKIYYLNLADIDNDGILQNRFAQDHKNSIIVLEDIDCIFHNRENKSKKKGVTFTGLLNCIDGLCSGDDGRILIMTTNHYDKLDPALIRPGRVDLTISVPNIASMEVFVEYITRLYSQNNPLEAKEFVESVYSDCKSTSMMIQKIQERWSIDLENSECCGGLLEV